MGNYREYKVPLGRLEMWYVFKLLSSLYTFFVQLPYVSSFCFLKSFEFVYSVRRLERNS